MRRVALLLLALSLFAIPAQAQMTGDPVFGQAWCTPIFRCPPAFVAENLRLIFPQLLSLANSCIGNNFALRTPRGYFEETLGLDSGLCLFTKPQPKATVGVTMVPKCCVTQVAGNPQACQLVCTQYGVR